MTQAVNDCKISLVMHGQAVGGKMKRIALIMEGWKRFFTYAWAAGILQRIKETGEEVNLYIFNSSGNWSRDEAFNTGEYNIYHLPDLAEFDGIILDLNNIRDQRVREYVIQTAEKTGRPVISVANDIEGFYYVGIDNYAAIREVADHLYEEHHCRAFWFVMGERDNYENMMRVRSLEDFMQEKGIGWKEEDIYFGNYEYRCGYEGFEKLLGSHTVLPDAVICANDNIAVGVCEAARTHGYQVPRDFCVTGFDDFDKAGYYSPSITTVSHIREEVGYQCADILLRLWEGEHVDHFTFTRTRCICGESCGCRQRGQADHRGHAREQIIYGIETDDFQDRVITLEYELMRCKTVKEMTDWIPRCIPAFQCDAMYLVLDDHINDFWKQPDYYDRHLIEDGEFMIKGYPERMNLEFAYEDGHRVDCGRKQIEKLFPMFDYPEGGTDFLFMPLHFGERTVGYFVIRNAVYLMERQYLFSVVNVLTSAMENLHKKEKLEYMNQMLSKLYTRDAMTGLYNRIGYEKIGCRMFEDKKRAKEDMIIMFLDMDRLKYINDHFGHEYGDAAIKIIAQAIQRCCPADAIPVRMGGDEFVLFLPQAEKEQLAQRLDAVRMEIRKEAQKQKLPFELTVSAGCIYTDMGTDKSLDDYIREADEIMYLEKMEKRAVRGS